MYKVVWWTLEGKMRVKIVDSRDAADRLYGKLQLAGLAAFYYELP